MGGGGGDDLRLGLPSDSKSPADPKGGETKVVGHNFAISKEKYCINILFYFLNIKISGLSFSLVGAAAGLAVFTAFAFFVLRSRSKKKFPKFSHGTMWEKVPQQQLYLSLKQESEPS